MSARGFLARLAAFDLRSAIYLGREFSFSRFALILLGVLYFFDVFIAWADVLEENKSRASQGGLPRGEYFMHVVLSLLVGAYLIVTFQAVWAIEILQQRLFIRRRKFRDFENLYDGNGRDCDRNFFDDLRKWLRFDEKIRPKKSKKSSSKR